MSTKQQIPMVLEDHTCPNVIGILGTKASLTSIFCHPDLLSKSQGWIKDTRDYLNRIRKSLFSSDSDYNEKAF